MPALADAIFWLEPAQARFAASLAERAGWCIAAAGFPRSASRTDTASEAAALLGIASPLTDLRHAVATTDARLLIVLSPQAEEGERPMAVGPLDDPQIISTCRSRGIDVLSLEPVPASLMDLSWQAEPAGPGPVLRQMPLFRRSSMFAQVRETLPLIGTVRSVFVAFTSPPAHGSLAARLVDACAAIEGLPGAGVPESVDASVTPPGAAGAVHLAPPERLRFLRGDMTANLRLPGAVTACMAISDHAGPWQRRLRIVGDLGVLDATDDALAVSDSTGCPMETPSPSGAGSPKPTALAKPLDAVAVTAAHARAELERRTVAEPVNWSAVLAIAEAALLSARTSQNESPATLLRMAGIPG